MEGDCDYKFLYWRVLKLKQDNTCIKLPLKRYVLVKDIVVAAHVAAHNIHSCM